MRRWARTHPWRAARVPTALMVLGDVFVRQVVPSESLGAGAGLPAPGA
ncbi:hypothetical protein ACFPFX_00650 [Streptomyces mauvecolor]|uniref:Uncharacterized protein n=1 Tax=Streptomyces mauvecolor TaxID=58345 RepID=A0ABV9UCC6_9ACTN